MADNTSAEDGPPSGSYPSVQLEPAARLQSYADYLARLDRSPFESHYLGSEEQLWLASFTEDGRYIKRDTCILDDSDRPKNPPAVNTILSPSDFRTLLQTTDENVPYRIVIAASNRAVPSSMMQDILGLGLDLEPEIFDYVNSTIEATKYLSERAFPLPWVKDAPALRIGGDALCILEKAPERKSKTAIIFLRDNDGFQLPPRNSLGSVMFSSKRPSQMRERSNQDSDDHARYYRKSLVERYITEAIESKTQFGPGNFLYICLAALLELHLSTAPTSVFLSGWFDGRQGITRKYRRNGLRTINESIPVSRYSDKGWSELRMELDHQRHTLRWMTRFFKRHLDYKNKDLQAAFKDIRERFKLRVQDLEQFESQLRDELASEGIDRSIRMAEMSIRESKRVMLLTALAFIFLPISLASSVYGMNIQQINGTGHPIKAFVITAFAMCASAVVLWGSIAGFQSRKTKLKKEAELSLSSGPTWKWYDRLIMFNFLGMLKLSWFRLRMAWLNHKRQRGLSW